MDRLIDDIVIRAQYGGLIDDDDGGGDGAVCVPGFVRFLLG